MFVPPSLQPSNASVRIGKQRTTQGVVLPLLVLIVIAATVETASEMRSYKIKPRRGEARRGEAGPRVRLDMCEIPAFPAFKQVQGRFFSNSTVLYTHTVERESGALFQA